MGCNTRNVLEAIASITTKGASFRRLTEDHITGPMGKVIPS